jgi:hypothetical protein
VTERDHIVLPCNDRGRIMSVRHYLEPVYPRSHPDRSNAGLKVLDPASVAVRTASRNGTVLVINAEADRLLLEHPDCQMSLAELRDFVARLAMRRRVPMQFG